MPDGTLERLMAKVVWNGDEDECWTWEGALAAGGYGACRAFGKNGKAHRVLFELFHGPVPRHLDLDHLCRNRACVNPAHLEPVTRSVNLKRGAGGQLHTHCKYGHPFDEKNTSVSPTGKRSCRKCSALRARRWRKENPKKHSEQQRAWRRSRPH